MDKIIELKQQIMDEYRIIYQNTKDKSKIEECENKIKQLRIRINKIDSTKYPHLNQK